MRISSAKIYAIIVLCILSFPICVFADTQIFAPSPTIPALQQGEYAPIIDILTVLPDPLGKIPAETFLDPRSQTFFVPYKSLQFTALSGGLWLRLPLEGKVVHGKHFFLNLGSAVATPIVVYRINTALETPKLEKLGTYSNSRIHLQTATLPADSTYTYYVHIPNIPTPFFAPILENRYTAVGNIVETLHTIFYVLLFVLIIFALLRTILQKKILFFSIILYLAALLILYILGTPPTPYGFITNPLYPIALLIVVFTFPFLATRFLAHKGSLQIQGIAKTYPLCSIVFSLLVLIPQIPTFAWLARYYTLWPLLYIFLLPALFSAIRHNYANARLYFLSAIIPLIIYLMTWYCTLYTNDAFLWSELLPLFGIACNVVCLSLLGSPFIFEYSNGESSSVDQETLEEIVPQWMQPIHFDPSEEHETHYNDPETIHPFVENVLYTEDDTEGEAYHVSHDTPNHEDTSQEIMQHPTVPLPTEPTVTKERIVNALQKEPRITPYSPRELFVYLYRALKIYSETYNVELSWFVDPDLDENQEHDSDVIYSTLYSIGESLIINNPNSSVHISAKNITDPSLPAHIRFSIMITPEDTLQHFNSNSVSQITELIALAGGTLFMGNAQGKRLEMIITLPAIAHPFTKPSQHEVESLQVSDTPSGVQEDVLPLSSSEPTSLTTQIPVSQNTPEESEFPEDTVSLSDESTDTTTLPDDDPLSIEIERQALHSALQNAVLAPTVEDDAVHTTSPLPQEIVLGDEDLADLAASLSITTDHTVDDIQTPVEQHHTMQDATLTEAPFSQTTDVVPDHLQAYSDMLSHIDTIIQQSTYTEDNVSADTVQTSNTIAAYPVDDTLSSIRDEQYSDIDESAPSADPTPSMHEEELNINMQAPSGVEFPVVDQPPTAVAAPSNEQTILDENTISPYTHSVLDENGTTQGDLYTEDTHPLDNNTIPNTSIIAENSQEYTAPRFTESIRNSVQELIEAQNIAELEDITPVFSDKASIIILDANSSDRKLLLYFLEDLPYALSDVSSTQALLKQHKHYPAHLIVIDTTTLDIPLEDVVRQLHIIDTQYAQNPVLILALTESHTHFEELKNAGAVAALVKPVHHDEFRSLIQQLLPPKEYVTQRTASQWQQHTGIKPKDLTKVSITPGTDLPEPNVALHSMPMEQNTTVHSEDADMPPPTVEEIHPTSITEMPSVVESLSVVASDDTPLLKKDLQAVEYEIQALPPEQYTAIPHFLNVLQILMKEAEFALRAGELYKIIDITQKIAQENTNFQLPTIAKIAQCITRAATVEDEQAVTQLFSELAEIMEKAIALLIDVYSH